jgi:hypothetical protein
MADANQWRTWLVHDQRFASDRPVSAVGPAVHCHSNDDAAHSRPPINKKYGVAAVGRRRSQRRTSDRDGPAERFPSKPCEPRSLLTRGPPVAFHQAIQRLLLLGADLEPPEPQRAHAPVPPPRRLAPLIEAISTTHQRFNQRAVKFGNRYRSGFWAVYLLSAFAVLCAVLPLVLESALGTSPLPRLQCRGSSGRSRSSSQPAASARRVSTTGVRRVRLEST